MHPAAKNSYKTVFLFSSWYRGSDQPISLIIAEMLAEYEADHHTDMNIAQIGKMLYDDTSGYPNVWIYQKSRGCRCSREPYI